MSDMSNIKKNLLEMVNKFPKETLVTVVKEVTKAGSVEEVKEIVRGFGQELTDEQAELLFRAYSEEIMLSDNELDKVSGGTTPYEGPGGTVPGVIDLYADDDSTYGDGSGSCS